MRELNVADIVKLGLNLAGLVGNFEESTLDLREFERVVLSTGKDHQGDQDLEELVHQGELRLAEGRAINARWAEKLQESLAHFHGLVELL